MVHNSWFTITTSTLSAVIARRYYPPHAVILSQQAKNPELQASFKRQCSGFFIRLLADSE